MINKTGGKRNKKYNNEEVNTPLIYKDNDQEYGLVLKLLGDRKVNVKCFDGKKRICLIRGKLRKRVWISEGDLVLVSLRDFCDDKADIIHKYSVGDIRELEKKKEISKGFGDINNEDNENKIEDVFDFDDI